MIEDTKFDEVAKKCVHSRHEEVSSHRVSEEYKEGGAAFFSGIAANPYPKGLRYDEWECGWCDAQGYDQYSRGEIDLNVC